MTAQPRRPLLHHRLDGPENGPPLILGPSLGTSLAVWEPSLPDLARAHRVLRWDLPGHGGSPTSLLPDGRPGATSVADLARLVLDLADQHGWRQFAYAGISLGGAVGTHLARHHSDRVRSLALVCSSARFGEPRSWAERAQLVRANGTEVLVAGTADRWFTARFADSARATALLDDLAAADAAGYAACCDALASYDLSGELPRIAVPTLVVAGREDPATPPAHARRLADGIPGASLLELAGAAHLANVERPEVVTEVLLRHLAATCPPATAGATDDRARHTAGLAVRRAVLGDAHVDRAIANSTTFTADFQDFITRYAWGEIWSRPGLDRRTRSTLTLTALVARGHLEELALHVRAALRNGLTPAEIGEVLLHTAIYCGVPAANAAFAVAQRILREQGADLDRPAANDPSADRS
ncbi:3-oxoadipate enol-lactonase [Micromonospora sp. NBC_00389]|uniref:bifunctional 3-oxoadipate enol-lactonase/4-carboxymuconolactone decarboxylase PcaDC n=1 Tax=Micromonospora sp. NBC_00389 TaxID=2903586 RepID=UPI002E251382